MFVLIELDLGSVEKVYGPFDTETQAMTYIEKYKLCYASIYPITEYPDA